MVRRCPPDTPQRLWVHGSWWVEGGFFPHFWYEILNSAFCLYKTVVDITTIGYTMNVFEKPMTGGSS